VNWVVHVAVETTSLSSLRINTWCRMRRLVIRASGQTGGYTGSPVQQQHALYHFLTLANQYVVHRTWLASPRSLVLNPYPKIAGILVHICSAETRLPRRPGNKISVLGQRWVIAYNGLVACIAPHLAVSSSAKLGLLLFPPSIERLCHYFSVALRCERHLLPERDISCSDVREGWK